MPWRPPHPCSVPGCPALVTRGARCREHLRALQREVDSLRPSAARRGYDHNWRRIRLAQLRREPLCRFCMERGVMTPATEVDHILALADGGTHAATNLRSACHSCHSRRTARDQAFGRRHRRTTPR
jgi:5-methylcytosine-specific restriction protein A